MVFSSLCQVTQWLETPKRANLLSEESRLDLTEEFLRQTHKNLQWDVTGRPDHGTYPAQLLSSHFIRTRPSWAACLPHILRQTLLLPDGRMKYRSWRCPYECEEEDLALSHRSGTLDWAICGSERIELERAGQE